MTTEELARQAGGCGGYEHIVSGEWRFTPEGLERFAALVRAQALERYSGVKEYLTAAADGSMSRNNSENIAAELLSQIEAP